MWGMKGAAGREPQVLLAAQGGQSSGKVAAAVTGGSGSWTLELPAPVQPSSSSARNERLRFSRQHRFAGRKEPSTLWVLAQFLARLQLFSCRLLSGDLRRQW